MIETKDVAKLKVEETHPCVTFPAGISAGPLAVPATLAATKHASGGTGRGLDCIIRQDPGERRGHHLRTTRRAHAHACEAAPRG